MPAKGAAVGYSDYYKGAGNYKPTSTTPTKAVSQSTQQPTTGPATRPSPGGISTGGMSRGGGPAVRPNLSTPWNKVKSNIEDEEQQKKMDAIRRRLKAAKPGSKSRTNPRKFPTQGVS